MPTLPTFSEAVPALIPPAVLSIVVRMLSVGGSLFLASRFPRGMPPVRFLTCLKAGAVLVILKECGAYVIDTVVDSEPFQRMLALVLPYAYSEVGIPLAQLGFSRATDMLLIWLMSKIVAEYRVTGVLRVFWIMLLTQLVPGVVMKAFAGIRQR